MARVRLAESGLFRIALGQLDDAAEVALLEVRHADAKCAVVRQEERTPVTAAQEGGQEDALLSLRPAMAAMRLTAVWAHEWIGRRKTRSSGLRFAHLESLGEQPCHYYKEHRAAGNAHPTSSSTYNQARERRTYGEKRAHQKSVRRRKSHPFDWPFSPSPSDDLPNMYLLCTQPIAAHGVRALRTPRRCGVFEEMD